MNSAEDLDILISSLAKKKFRLVFAQYFHKGSIIDLEKRIVEAHPHLRVGGIRLDYAEVKDIRDYLSWEDRSDVFLMHDFHSLNTEEGREKRIYLNQHRDALAAHPVCYIALVDGHDNMLQVAHNMPDLWSFRTMVVELPLPNLVSSTEVWDSRFNAATHGPIEPMNEKEAKRLEKRWYQLIRKGTNEELANSTLLLMVKEWEKQPDPRLRLRKFEQLLETLENPNGFHQTYQRIKILLQLASVQNNFGHYAKAIKLAEEAITISQTILEENNILAAKGFVNLGTSHLFMGNHLEAMNNYGRALIIYSTDPVGNEEEVAGCLNNIGMAYLEIGEPKKAEKYLEDARRQLIKVFGYNHPLVAHCYNNLGLMFMALNNLDLSKWHLETALSITINALGHEHPDVATRLGNLGLVWKAKGDYEKSMAYLEQSLAILKKTVGETHPDVANCYNSMGTVLNLSGDSEKAIVYLRKALELSIQILGKEHPDVANRLNNIGTFLIEHAFLREGLEMLQASLNICEKIYGPTHEHTLFVRNNLDKVKAALNSEQKSMS